MMLTLCIGMRDYGMILGKPFILSDVPIPSKEKISCIVEEMKAIGLNNVSFDL